MTTSFLASISTVFPQVAVSRENVKVAGQVIVDNAGLAWSCCDQSPYDYLPTGLVDDYRADLDIAATELLGPVLATCWEARGYRVVFGTRDEAENDPVPNELCHAVWNEAAAQLCPDLIVRAAGLDDERRTYS